MTETSVLQARLAEYYVGRLRAANTIFRRGLASSAESTALLGQEWGQIAQWQAWAAAHSAQSGAAARLCARYAQDGAEILVTRQTLQERAAWQTTGLTAARAIGDAPAAAACLLRLAWTIYKQTQNDEAEELARQALDHAESIRDTLLIGQSLHLLGEIAMRRASLDEAERLCLRGVALLRPIDAQAMLADVYFSLSEIASLHGDYAGARDYAQQCYQIHMALGLNPTTNNNLTWLGLMTAGAGDPATGEVLVRRSVALCRASGAQGTLAHGLLNLCDFMILGDRWEEARRYAEEGLQIAQAIGETWLVPYGLIATANISSRTGNHVAAQAPISRAVALVRGAASQIAFQDALFHLAEIQVRADDVERARGALHEGLVAAVQTGLTGKMLYGILIAAELWRRRGDGMRAAEWAGLLLSSHGLDIVERKDLQSLCAELTDVLGVEAFTAAVECGKDLRIETVAERIVDALGGSGPG